MAKPKNMKLRRVLFVVAAAGLFLSSSLASMPGAGASPVILPFSLWVMDVDGSDPHRLLRSTSHDSDAAEWSPDGTMVAIEKDQQIVVVDLADRTKRVLTPEGSNWDPAWAPDGSSIAFTAARGASGTDIYTIAPDGTREEQVTTHARRDGSPEWSPDGKAIVFIRSGPSGGLFTVDMANKQATKLVGGVYGDIDWSSDGEHLVFISAHDIWTVSRDGSGVNNLTHSDAWEYSPVWSPNEPKIAYCAGSSLYLVGADGKGRQRLIRGTDCLYGVSWSPDGSRIAFSKDGDIWSIRPDGSGPRRIRRSPGGEVSPSWSPDDRHIAYLRR